MKKFRLNYNVITEHEVLSETAKFITYKTNWGRETRESKNGKYSNWFDTKEEAINYRIKELHDKIEFAELRLKNAKEELEGFKIDNPL